MFAKSSAVQSITAAVAAQVAEVFGMRQRAAGMLATERRINGPLHSPRLLRNQCGDDVEHVDTLVADVRTAGLNVDDDVVASRECALAPVGLR